MPSVNFGNSFQVKAMENDRSVVNSAIAEIASTGKFSKGKIRSSLYTHSLYLCGESPGQDQVIRDVFRKKHINAQEYQKLIPGSCPRKANTIAKGIQRSVSPWFRVSE